MIRAGDKIQLIPSREWSVGFNFYLAENKVIGTVMRAGRDYIDVRYFHEGPRTAYINKEDRCYKLLDAIYNVRRGAWPL